ncbi:hypothetical protein D7I43_21265 [Micromonospora globbae]|uniref:Uncharacterized protein n=1 Tax=Micromonospora globbae TaxID=1894969 RepID=A0A420EX59_9ACTN|nr:hypothetical protein D7I43_21265 [Micromonospora globbae]
MAIDRLAQSESGAAGLASCRGECGGPRPCRVWGAGLGVWGAGLGVWGAGRWRACGVGCGACRRECGGLWCDCGGLVDLS